MLNLPIPTVQPSVSATITQVITLYVNIMTNLPELKANLTNVNDIDTAAQIISKFISKYGVPNVDVYQLLMNYLKNTNMLSRLYVYVQYSQNLQQLITKLINYFSSGNNNLSDPNFYSNIFVQIMTSGIFDFNSLINPPTLGPSQTGLPQFTLPMGLDFSMLLPPYSFAPMLNDPVLTAHITKLIPLMVAQIINLKNPTVNDILNVIDNVFKAHLNTDIINMIKFDLQTINPVLYQQVKDITDPNQFYPYVSLYIQSAIVYYFKLNGIFDIFGTTTSNPATFNPTTTPNQQALTNALTNLISELNLMWNSATDKNALLFSLAQKHFNTLTVIAALKERIRVQAPQLYETIRSVNDINILVPLILPQWRTLFLTDIQAIIIQNNLQLPPDMQALLGISFPTIILTTITSSSRITTTGIQTSSNRPATTTSDIRLVSLYQKLEILINQFIQGVMSIPNDVDAQIRLFDQLFITNLNDPVSIDVLKSRVQLFNPNLYSLIQNTNNINDLYSYLKPNLIQLITSDDIDTLISRNPNNIYLSMGKTTILNFIRQISASATTPSPLQTTASTPTTAQSSTTRTTTTIATTTTTPTTSTATTTKTTTTTARPTTTTARPTTTTTTTTTTKTTINIIDNILNRLTNPSTTTRTTISRRPFLGR